MSEPESMREIGGSYDDDRPYGIFADKVVHNFLCDGDIIQGNPTIPGVVFPGKENGQEANILFTLQDLSHHCTSCPKKEGCKEEKKNEIIKIFTAQE